MRYKNSELLRIFLKIVILQSENTEIMIKTIVFDFGKVLVDYEFDHFLVPLFKGNVPEVEKFKAVMCNEEFVMRMDKGETSFEDLIAEKQTEYPQWNYELQEFRDRQIEIITEEIPGMRSLIHRLRAAGYGIYGLTNWCNNVYEVIEKFDILQLMDDRLISSEEKLIKPHVDIYRRFCDKFGFKAEECVFTDDKLSNILGARQAGMHAIQFFNAAQFEQELKQLISF